MRLDKALTLLEEVESRTKAQRLLKAGVVRVNGQIVKQKSYVVTKTDEISLIYNPFPYVSRAGLKLEKAANSFGVSFVSKVMLDVGASTGGFTDYALTNGISRIYAVDVGTDQLHSRLKEDSRVVSYEQTDARSLTSQHIPESVDIITVDVSFISLSHMFPVVKQFMNAKTELITLIKPQFEAGPQYKGLVKDAKTHLEVLSKTVESAGEQDLRLQQLTYSPILGDSGNIEFLALFTFDRKESIKSIEDVVFEAHKNLLKSD